MKTFAKFVLLSLLLVVMSGIVSASDSFDDEGIANDPFVNPRANACFFEGADCETEDEWRLG